MRVLLVTQSDGLSYTEIKQLIIAAIRGCNGIFSDYFGVYYGKIFDMIEVTMLSTDNLDKFFGERVDSIIWHKTFYSNSISHYKTREYLHMSIL